MSLAACDRDSRHRIHVTRRRRAEIGVAYFLEIDLRSQIGELRGADVDRSNARFLYRRGEVPIRGLQLFDFATDLRSHFGQRGGTLRRGEFRSVVFAGIVTGRDVDGAIELALYDRPGNGRRWHLAGAEQGIADRSG